LFVSSSLRKEWVDRFGGALNILHVVDVNALGRPPALQEDFRYKELSDLMAKRTADLEYFTGHYFGNNIAYYTVLSGDRSEQIEIFFQAREH